MASDLTLTDDFGGTTTELHIRTIGMASIRRALLRGIDDFSAKPSHLVILGLVYPAVALVASRFVFGYEVLPILFPLIAGFVLLGPVGAVGFYELSRCREQGLEVSWRKAFGLVDSPAMFGIGALAAFVFGIFLVWLFVAWLIFEATLGVPPASIGAFVDSVLRTEAGWNLIVVGNGIGFLFAVAVLMISVVSFPMMIDHHVEPTTAVKASVLAVLRNPGPMAAWGLIVVLLLALGSIPAFVGLAVVVPVLGHATWHLYREVVGD